MQSSDEINDSNAEDLDDNTRSTIHNSMNDRFARVNIKLKKNGWIVLHVLASCYCFLMLAVVCDEYFIGSIEVLCQSMLLHQRMASTENYKAFPFQNFMLKKMWQVQRSWRSQHLLLNFSSIALAHSSQKAILELEQLLVQQLSISWQFQLVAEYLLVQRFNSIGGQSAVTASSMAFQSLA